MIIMKTYGTTQMKHVFWKGKWIIMSNILDITSPIDEPLGQGYYSTRKMISVDVYLHDGQLYYLGGKDD